MTQKCKICNFICEPGSLFKISTTYTLHSKTPLQNFIEIVIEDSFDFLDNCVCSLCYDLLNELDKCRENYRVGCERIKWYLQSVEEDDTKPQDSVEEEIKEQRAPEHIEIIYNVNSKSESENQTEKSDLSKVFTCKICGVSYRTQKSLKVHVGMHNGINPFTCEYCNKSFLQKINLIRHLPLHTGETPFQCDICGKTYIHDSSFRLHKKRHQGRKDVKCDTCNLAFFSKSHLSRHRRIHTGEKNYTCKICGKSFAEKYNLVAHEKLHGSTRPEREYRCEICDADFYKKSSLEGHLVHVHQKINTNDTTTEIV